MDTDTKPLILVTNDDSIDARGLHKLIECARRHGQVYAVAPLRPQSGQSSSLTVDMPLHINERESGHEDVRLFTVDGTPVDCVKLAMHTILPRRADMVLAGINHGSNAANNITYSGTMGAVVEGCMEGIPSVGFSLCHHSLKADFDLSLEFVDRIIGQVMVNGMPDYVALNVNIPALVRPLGVRTCRAARGRWTDQFKRYLDPMGRPFYLLTGNFVNLEPDATDTDEYWLAKNYISLVPVTPDQTAYPQIAEMSKLYDC